VWEESEKEGRRGRSIVCERNWDEVHASRGGEERMRRGGKEREGKGEWKQRKEMRVRSKKTVEDVQREGNDDDDLRSRLWHRGSSFWVSFLLVPEWKKA
jgi:hypothetical protein